MSGPTDPILIDSPSDNDRDSGRQVDASVYTLAAVFGAAALPAGMPDYLKERIEREANFAQALDTAGMTIGGMGGGPLNAETKAEREARKTEEAVADLRATTQTIEERRQEEHEREWLGSTHSYAGQTLDGDDWKAMIDWFRDNRNVEAWEDRMIAETGQTRDEVRRTGGKMKRFYDLMEKDAKGTLNGDERTEFTALQHDKELRRGLEVQEEIQGIRAAPASDATARNDATHDADQQMAVSARASLFDDDGGSLSAVKPITSIYQTAASGNPPPAPVPVKPAPAMAANTIQLSPDNMFG